MGFEPVTFRVSVTKLNHWANRAIHWRHSLLSIFSYLYNENANARGSPCVEMEVDKEPMDLSNSSRTSLATTELVDSPIFTTFYFVFCVFSFLLYLYCITPRSSHWHLQFKSPFHSVIVTYYHLLIYSSFTKCKHISCFHLSSFFSFSDFHHFQTEFQALNLSTYIYP